MTHHHPHEHGSGPLADASVRTARVADAPAVGLVQATVWREAYAGVVPEDVLAGLDGPTLARVWRRSLESPPSPRHRLLVACAGDQVVGLAALAPVQDDQAVGGVMAVLELSVHPQARRAGHGSRLLNALADTAREQGATGLEAWVAAADEATRAFAELAGLAPDGSWRDRVVGPRGETAREVRVAGTL